VRGARRGGRRRRPPRASCQRRGVTRHGVAPHSPAGVVAAITTAVAFD